MVTRFSRLFQDYIYVYSCTTLIDKYNIYIIMVYAYMIFVALQYNVGVQGR